MRLVPAAAWPAGLSAALWPNLIVHSSLVLQDTLLLFFMTGFLISIVRFARHLPIIQPNGLSEGGLNPSKSIGYDSAGRSKNC